ncbi:heparinase II/III family protein [Gemmatimonadota bacterium]
MAENTFHIINQEKTVATAGDWNNPAWERLWLYNLHYFDDLNCSNNAERHQWHVELIERWIDENRPGHGTGWEPYPISRRVVNWIKWSLNGNTLSPVAEHSLAISTRFLSKKLEYHILANHLLANAKALIFAGLYFGGDEARTWFQTGLRILGREISEQILPDGGHFERSPMYHALILEDLLDLINLYNCYGKEPDPVLIDAVKNMQRWLLEMCHPDGGISFFNDSTHNVALKPHDLYGYSERLGIRTAEAPKAPLVRLSESGYVRAQIGNSTLLADLGPIGPDYQPGHAHADTLSFEFSIGRQRVLVNSGTSTYTAGEERLRQRGSAAHNTVLVDGENSSEVWDSFRVARRAKVRDIITNMGRRTVSLSGCHDGFKHLSGSPVHYRSWYYGRRRLIISDSISGRGLHCIEAWFHLHPDISILRTVEKQVVLTVPHFTSSILIDHFGPGNLDVVDSTYHPGFGVSMPGKSIVYRLHGKLPAQLKTYIHWK